MTAPNTSLRTPLARVRGLGAAKHGTSHFITQRVTAIALVPLVIWFVWALVTHAGAPYAETVAFLAHPVNATLMLIFAVTAIWHFKIGMQVVIEDYVGNETAKLVAIMANTFFSAAVGLASIYAIVKLSSGV